MAVGRNGWEWVGARFSITLTFFEKVYVIFGFVLFYM